MEAARGSSCQTRRADAWAEAQNAPRLRASVRAAAAE